MLPKKKINDDADEQSKSKSKSKKMMMMSRRCLISVNVLGSAGPLRFVTNEKDNVDQVIETALKLYGREKRLPLLGNQVNHFLLYPANAGLDALSPSVAIGSQEIRTFVLCKKERRPQMTESRSEMVSRKKGNSFKAWINKSLSFKISSSSSIPLAN